MYQHVGHLALAAGTRMYGKNRGRKVSVFLIVAALK